MVEAGQGFEGQVEALIMVLVAAGSEEVQRLIQVEGVGLEEVSHHEFVNFGLVLLVQVLEFVQRHKPLDVEPVGQHRVRNSIQ